MTEKCMNCKTPNESGARYCQNCGYLLGATRVHGRTVVMSSPSQTHRPPVDDRTILQRAECTFGAGETLVNPVTATMQRMDQREQIVIVNDRSSSMGEVYDRGVTKLEAAIRASVNLVLGKYQIDPHDEVGLVIFNSCAEILLDMSSIASHKKGMIEILQTLTADNGTDINAGLIAARDVFDWSRTDVVRRVALLTDGHGGDPLHTAEDLKARGVVLDVIGIGPQPSQVDETLLKKVASVIEGQLHYRFVKDHQTLVAHYTQLANKTATGQRH